MVNRGQPSRDCLPCRKRKIRCDLQKAGCGQCKRAGMQCSGYRDPKDLIFRDQTQKTEQKVQKENPQTALQVRVSHYPSVDWRNPSLVPAPQLSWNAKAREAFFSYYVFGLSRSYDTLASIYSSGVLEDHLDSSVDAVSLAFLAHQHQGTNPGVLRLANKHYLSALRKLNHALSSQQRARSDASLLSVLLLDLYEKMVGADLRLPASWTGHIFGGIALINIRGHNDVIRGRVSRRLATVLYIKTLISCMIAAKRVPQSLMELGESLDSFNSKDDLKWQIIRKNEQTINFRVDVMEHRFSSNTDVVSEARRLHGRYVELAQSISERWMPKRVLIGEDSTISLMFGDHYDVYEDHVTTQGRNVLRTLHLNILRIVQQHPLPDGADEELRDFAVSSRITIEQFAREIYASAPQFILLEGRPGNSIPFTPFQALQCQTLLAPLYVAGHASTDPTMRRRIVTMLRYMADPGGMRSAQKAADVLEFQPEMEFWNVYAMLGGYAFAS